MIQVQQTILSDEDTLWQPAPIFDHHIHCDGRNADDYEWMALTGTKTVMIPCTATEPRRDGASLLARYHRLTEDEVARAAHYGVDAHIALAVHPGDLPANSATIEALVSILADQLSNKRVKAIGELSLRSGSAAEQTALRLQLELANEQNLPVMIETAPWFDKYQADLPTFLQVIEQSDINPKLISFMDMDVAKWEPLSRMGFGPAGVAVSPHSDALFTVRQKLDDREVVELLERFPESEFMLNTGFHYGSADPFGLARVAHRLQIRQNLDARIVRRLVHDTAWYRFIAARGE